MPHRGRVISSSGYYHVVPKGIHDQLIFESDQDRLFYLKLLQMAKGDFGLLIHAYCLMGNHVHLVTEDPSGKLASFMKLVDERYGRYFSERTGRKGGVFVRPFWSEPIENDGYLLCAVRYVHANPAAAGICPASVYKWSSAKDYLGRKGIADTKTVLEMLGGRDGFIDWSKASNLTAKAFPGSLLEHHLSDDEALRIACDITGIDVTRLAGEGKESRQQIVCKLVTHGFNHGQIARMTGLGRGAIRSLAARATWG